MTPWIGHHSRRVLGLPGISARPLPPTSVFRSITGRNRAMLFHVTIRDEEGVETMSIGEGRYRQVLVVPEGAPEYEDALNESS